MTLQENTFDKNFIMKIFITVLFLVCSLNWVSGQIQISGKVTYRSKPIKDVNVTLKDSYDGSTTDENGNYSFSTTETGAKTLIFTNPNYDEVEKNIQIAEMDIIENADLKEKISEIDAVVISAGAIEASDKKRATALLTPLDIYTTAGSDGQISSALNYLPGVQKVGETEGLFIRGGSGTESKIFMDGALINNYFTSSVPGIAGRDRFNTSLFKGNVFSSGGYSALYGQALSGILILESIDFPETSSYDFGISPIFVNAAFQKVDADKTYSFGGGVGYSNLTLMTKLLKFNTDFTTSPHGLDANFNFRFKTKSGGMIKYYGSFDNNQMTVQNPSLEPEFEKTEFGIKGQNAFHTLSYRQKFGKYLANCAASYSLNHADLEVQDIFGEQHSYAFDLDTKASYYNVKGILERKIGVISAVRGGFEGNYTSENFSSQYFSGTYTDFISSLFAETDLGFSNNFSVKIGGRAENSTFLKQWNFAPRIALAYRFNKTLHTSLAYGIFYQNPESKYVNSSANLDFQKSEHAVLQIQKNVDGRSLRAEVFYKKYDQLIRTTGTEFYQTASDNGGSGAAKGIEFFWRDKKTFKNIDYWLTYSYLDTQRNFLNYPEKLTPGFAAKHTFSAVAKKFVTDWKTGFNVSYTYASGRPYYDIITDNGKNIIRNFGKLKDYSSMNFSVNYLPNLGKANAKSFTVLVLSISNILGNNNIYGYNFSQDGTRRNAVMPPAKTFVFIGAFISFGIDRTNNAINNNL